MARTRLVTTASGSSSVAPAEALVTTGVTAADRCSGMITPWAPRTYAERMMAPRLCGSWTPSSATTSDGSPRAPPAATSSSRLA
jgi:hypothetical protein